MSLVINHNMMAMNTARNLNNTYGRLSSSVERLSSGLRINSAADDAAGLAIRELMRADIATMRQGIRNAADAISMIQTADGGMAVIDEKLTRMKELAEQAATGTYTTLQREIINSEYQAMAAEIDRIAAATNFNGVKLLDGSITNLHGGLGMKIHFGVGNSPDEDYYFINTGDVRATSTSGLRIGGDAKNDIWGQGAAGAKGLAGPGCCTAGYDSLDGPAGFKSGETFSYGYNWDWTEDDDPELLKGRYLAGRYTVNSSDSLQDLINKVNLGTQSRVGIKLDPDALAAAIKNGGTAAVCMGNEAYIFGSAAVAGGTVIIPPVSGVVYRHTASGDFTGLGFLANIKAGSAGYGFSLTQAQIEMLRNAGINVSALGLSSVSVAASGASLVNSGQAKTQMLARLLQAWNALNLNSFSGLAINSGVTSGFTITSSMLKACAGTTVLSGTGLTATIISGQTLNVHTGIFADEYGNWTSSKRVASALGLSEVVFHINNQGVPTFTYQITGNTYTSAACLASANGSTKYFVNSTVMTSLIAAGITAANLSGFGAASISAKPKTDAVSAAALANFVASAQAAWVAKYSGSMELSLSASPGGGLTGPTAAAISASASTGVLSGTGVAATATIHSGETLKIYTNIFVDANGNFTNEQSVRGLFDNSHFERLVFEVENGLGCCLITVSGIASTVYSATGVSNINLSTLAANLNSTYISTAITSIQGAASGSPTGQGRLKINPPLPSTPFEPTQAQLSPSISTNPVGNLAVTVDIGGSQITVPTGNALAGLPRATDLGNLVAAAQSSLSQILSAAQTAGLAAGKQNVGLIVTDKAVSQTAPSTVADVANMTVTRTFYSGTLDRSVATGTYSNSGDVFNSSLGYALTSAQKNVLLAAGLNLSALLLASAIVSGSAISTVSSAEARLNLVNKLSQLWSALNLASMSSITIASGDTNSFSALTVNDVINSAATGIFNGTGDYRTLKEQTSMKVHTGIYADEFGNWTTDKSLASGLGMTELVYTVQNNNYTPVLGTATVKSSQWAVSGDLTITDATRTALGAASATLATILNSFVSASATIAGSGASSAAARAVMNTNLISAWNAAYGSNINQLLFNVSDKGSSIPALTLKDVYSGNTAGLDGQGPNNQIVLGGTITVSANIWVDGTGNWTDDSAIAAAFGLEKLVYSITNTAGNYITTVSYGVNTFSLTSPDSLAGPIPAEGLEALRGHITDSIQLVMAGMSGTDQGKLSRGAQVTPPRPQIGTSASFTDMTGYNTAGDPVSGLNVAVNFPGGIIATAIVPQTIYMNMGDLTALINADLDTILTNAQSAGNSSGKAGLGRVSKTAFAPHPGPDAEEDIEGLDWEDIYKPASGRETVTTTGIVDKTKYVTLVASAGTPYLNASGISNFGAWALASAINHNPNSEFWAMVQNVDSQGHSADMVYVFAKEGGDLNHLLACDVADGDQASRDALQAIEFENVEGNKMNQSGTNFTLGGQNWGTFKPIQTKAGMGKEVWNLTLHGRDVGKERDLWIAALSDGQNEVVTPGLTAGIINGLDRHSFVEIQNADNGQWAGAEVRTQSSAQEALDALNKAMERKDKVRADIGALQNRLENTITNLEIQVESLQASESRISDVDVATEMTEFVRNQVLAQAAVSMLSQANSLPQMALSLLNG
jgi:flagellin